jgi:hypothetical protein
MMGWLFLGTFIGTDNQHYITGFVTAFNLKSSTMRNTAGIHIDSLLQSFYHCVICGDGTNASFIRLV